MDAHSTISRVAASLALVLGTLLLGAGSAVAAPNVVVIQTDDQSLNTLHAMQRTQELVGDAGVTFDRYYASLSLCCPSRASLLTGRYAHNHGVERNVPPNGSYYALDSSRTLPVWLQRAGYVTAHVGKYLNGYLLGVPSGWTEWYTGMDPTTYRYYNYILNENGIPHLYGSRPNDYQTDVLTRKAVRFIERRAPGPRPFFLSLDYLAPHTEVGTIPFVTEDTPPIPAPRHEGSMGSVALPEDPSFNEADVSDKPAHVRNRPLLTTADRAEITERYRARLESLLAVDEGIEAVIAALAETGELANTYIFVISDNGWMDGQHRYPRAKRRIYEPSMHLPLLVRGPGVAPGTHTRSLAVNVDLAPTIVELAGARADFEMDGRSLVPLLSAPATDWSRQILHEYVAGEGPLADDTDPSFEGVRTDTGLVYVEHATGERELYDLNSDPFQLESLHDDPSYAAQRDAMAARLAELRQCAGASCR